MKKELLFFSSSGIASPKYGLWLVTVLISLCILSSCQKDKNDAKFNGGNRIQASDIRLPKTQAEKELVEKIKQVASILEVIYKDENVRKEVAAAVASGYYKDEFVALKDLLNPLSSPVYKTNKFQRQSIQQGIFEKKFKEEFDNRRSATDVAMRTAGDYFEENGITIYFPYSEEFLSSRGYQYTLVAADRDADEGTGRRPTGTSSDGRTTYESVTVNDDYAFINPTHIVGVIDRYMLPGGTDSLPPPPPTVTIDRVFHGYSRLGKNYDKLISFTGNGGGSEMKIARISGYLQIVNQQVTNFAGDLISVNYSRRDVKKARWLRVYGVWDPDWVAQNNEQVYSVYEEDTEGTGTFTGSLSTTLKLDSAGTGTIQGSIGFSVTVKTQDELVTQRKIGRTAYFLTTKQDQGWGFNMCNYGSASPCLDNTFLPANQYWALWDVGTNWKYNWPYKIYY